MCDPCACDPRCMLTNSAGPPRHLSSSFTIIDNEYKDYVQTKVCGQNTGYKQEHIDITAQVTYFSIVLKGNF